MANVDANKAIDRLFSFADNHPVATTVMMLGVAACVPVTSISFAATYWKATENKEDRPAIEEG